ncbi:BPSL0067 family protein [Paraburkholderia sp. D15]|uniref:BPSL0067 family protein n=1 Tax=Paraburkholderia sp. D15 TaxID=2880218 RepID=UPI00247A8D18|nr:BPSL0067 family protein [Paraburkholderia sp. D15]WGS50055.1 BPSL0067 family protein [Paraburkholderia sp. D15]
MPYVANLAVANALKGQLVGDGQCVSFVHEVVSIPASSLWNQGDLVKGSSSIAPGTVIATFDSNGRYGNHTDGRSHAAIYLGQNETGIRVLDQWNGHTQQPVHERTIRFRNGHGPKVNDGDQFYVVR